MQTPNKNTLKLFIKTVDPKTIQNIFGKSYENFSAFVLEDAHPKKELFSPKRLEKIANEMDIPIPFLFLDSLPQQEETIPDFRSKQPSIGKKLKKHIRQNKKRQEWFSDYLQRNGFEPFAYPKHKQDTQEIAKTIIQLTQYQKGIQLPTLKENLGKHNILVCQSGSLHEVRGYAINDPYAPLIFICSDDPTTEGKIFTLMHEMAHILLEKEGVSGDCLDIEIEYQCNEIAGEVLMPTSDFLQKWERGKTYQYNIQKLRVDFGVSALAVATKAWLKELITSQEYYQYKSEIQTQFKSQTTNRGGNYYTNLASRISPLFAKVIATSVINGQETYREATKLIGAKTFNNIDKLFNYFNRNA